MNQCTGDVQRRRGRITARANVTRAHANNRRPGWDEGVYEMQQLEQGSVRYRKRRRGDVPVHGRIISGGDDGWQMVFCERHPLFEWQLILAISVSVRQLHPQNTPRPSARCFTILATLLICRRAEQPVSFPPGLWSPRNLNPQTITKSEGEEPHALVPSHVLRHASRIHSSIIIFHIEESSICLRSCSGGVLVPQLQISQGIAPL